MDFGHGAFLFVFAIVVGAYGTLVGAGGGFLIVPMLLLTFDLTPAAAAGTSLLAVFFNGVSAAISYARQRRIDYAMGVTFAIASVPGSVVGAYLSEYFSGRAFTIAFGSLLVGLAIFMNARPREARLVAREEVEAITPPKRWYVRRRLLDATGQSHHYEYHQPAGLILSVAIGLLSSSLGIGAGFIYVPLMVYFFGVPLYLATATTMFILAISSFAGSISHFILGNVLVEFALLLSVGVIIGAQIGARISVYLKGPWIVRLLSIALVAAGLRLIVRGFQAS